MLQVSVRVSSPIILLKIKGVKYVLDRGVDWCSSLSGMCDKVPMGILVVRQSWYLCHYFLDLDHNGSYIRPYWWYYGTWLRSKQWVWGRVRGNRAVQLITLVGFEGNFATALVAGWMCSQYIASGYYWWCLLHRLCVCRQVEYQMIIFLIFCMIHKFNFYYPWKIIQIQINTWTSIDEY